MRCVRCAGAALWHRTHKDAIPVNPTMMEKFPTAPWDYLLLNFLAFAIQRKYSSFFFPILRGLLPILIKIFNSFKTKQVSCKHMNQWAQLFGFLHFLAIAIQSKYSFSFFPILRGLPILIKYLFKTKRVLSKQMNEWAQLFGFHRSRKYSSFLLPILSGLPIRLGQADSKPGKATPTLSQAKPSQARPKPG